MKIQKLDRILSSCIVLMVNRSSFVSWLLSSTIPFPSYAPFSLSVGNFTFVTINMFVVQGLHAVP